MNKIITLLTVLILGSSGYTQDSVKIKRFEIGTNVTYLISNLFGYANYLQSAYELTYKYHFNKLSLRGGIGAEYGQDISNSINSDIDRTYSIIGTRLGFEIPKPINDKFKFYYGLDFSYQNTKNDYTTIYEIGSHYSITNSTTVELGVAAISGIQWNITNRIGLQTEFGIGAYASESVGAYEYMYPGAVEPEFYDTRGRARNVYLTVPGTVRFVILL